MLITACGINHKTAPLAIREKFSLVPEQTTAFLQDLHQQQFKEIAILSTCNRTEYYYETKAHEQLMAWLCQRYECQQQALTPYLYVYNAQAAVRHIIRVASGLDSMVLGEPQILGQMKAAYSTADELGTIGPQLQRLFQYVFSVTKEIRTTTGIGANPVSIAYAAVHLSQKIFSDLSKSTVMVIGAGETIELVIRYLKQQGCQRIFVVNRTFAKAQNLAEKYRGQAATFVDIAHRLQESDIVISATSSAIPILGKGTVERVCRSRKDRPIFMVDLAVPRDIEPEIAELDEVYLYSIDDLQQVIESSLSCRQDAAMEAERIIDLQVEHYLQWLKSLDVVNTIRAFRDKIEYTRDKEMEAALQLLRQGALAEEALCHLARNLTNKFMHQPTVQLRHAGYEQDLETLALARKLFQLED